MRGSHDAVRTPRALAVESGTVVSGLDGTTVRIRPQGSYSALCINQNGTGYHNVVHMYHIYDSSRFYLEKADSDSDGDWYKIRFYQYYPSTEPYDGYYTVFDIDGPSKDEGEVIHVTGDADKDNKKWRFIRLSDGSYYIKSKYSDKYWALKDSDIDANDNKLCQSSSPLKWEVEIIATESGDVINDNVKQYDFYNLNYNGKTVTGCNWMSCLPDYYHLTSLSISGVHDACTCNILNSGSWDILYMLITA